MKAFTECENTTPPTASLDGRGSNTNDLACSPKHTLFKFLQLGTSLPIGPEVVPFGDYI